MCSRVKLSRATFWVIALLPLANATAAESPARETTTRATIRTFDVPTLEKLGRDIYRHDQLAWIGTDVLLEKYDEQRLAKEGAAGWVVDESGDAPKVCFIRKNKEGVFEAAYDVVFPKDAKPRVVIPEDRTLTPGQLARYRASRSALDALRERRLPWCGGTPNTVVLSDPDGSGLLVYVLRPKPSMDVVPVGGHYRFTVSEDGTKVEQVDQLFASCLALPKSKGVPKGGELVSLFMSHVVSDTPLETHVFLSLQEKLPFSVVTPDGQIWSVENGSMTKQGSVKESK